MRGFVFGAVVGALLAVLMAPRRGDETREMVRARVGFWQDQFAVKLDRVASDVESMRHDMMTKLEDIRAQFGVQPEAGADVTARRRVTATETGVPPENPPEPPTRGA